MIASDYNFFGYRIVSNATLKNIDGVTAAFKYRGYDVSFSTYMHGGAKILVFREDALIGEYGTVEAAVKAVDEIINWRGEPVPAFPVQPGRRHAIAR